MAVSRVGKPLRLPLESLSLHTAHNNAFFSCVQNMRRCKTLFCKFEDYLFCPGRKTSCPTRTRIGECINKCIDKMTGYVINMEGQVESLPFLLQDHHEQGGQGPCLLQASQTNSEGHCIGHPSDDHLPRYFSKPVWRSALPPPNFLPVLSPSLLLSLPVDRPTRVSRPQIDGALHLRYNFAWAAFISSLSSTRERWRESTAL